MSIYAIFFVKKYKFEAQRTSKLQGYLLKRLGMVQKIGLFGGLQQIDKKPKSDKYENSKRISCILARWSTL